MSRFSSELYILKNENKWEKSFDDFSFYGQSNKKKQQQRK